MKRSFVFFIICNAIGLGMVALHPSPALASDYGPMVTQLLFMLAVMSGVALILGGITGAFLVWVYRRKWFWFLIPIFAICWFGVVFGLFQLWMNRDAHRYKNWTPRKVPVQVPTPSPDGI